MEICMKYLKYINDVAYVIAAVFTLLFSYLAVFKDPWFTFYWLLDVGLAIAYCVLTWKWFKESSFYNLDDTNR